METRLSGLRHDLGEVELVWVLFSDAKQMGKKTQQKHFPGSLEVGVVWEPAPGPCLEVSE